MSDQIDRAASVLWETSRRDEGTMSAAGAVIAARALADAGLLATTPEVKRLRAGIEELVTTYRRRWDEEGDMEAHGYADDLIALLDSTEGETDE